MRRSEIQSLLSAHREDLVAGGVRSLRLFGSAARDEATDTSDVDLLVEFDQPMGLFGLIRLKRKLEGLLQVEKVDLLTPGGLHPALKDRILAEAVDVF